jgi:hypothetical protein
MKNENKVKAFKRLFPGNREYVWESKHSKDFLKFQVIELDGLIRDKILVSVKILDYSWDGISKKLLDQTGLMVLTRIMKKPLNFDFSMCSINDFDIYIINSSQFSLPEKQKRKPSYTIYTGRGGFETLRDSSYLLQDDIVDDSIMSYSMALGVNRRK